MMKICTNCKVNKELSDFHKSNQSKDGLRYYCKSCCNEKQRNYFNTEKGKLVYKKNTEKDWLNPKNLYTRAKAYCKQRNHLFALSCEEYINLYNLPCYYCNNILCNSGLKKGISLDRIDNLRGYEIDNVLPCGGFCNKTRGDRLSVTEMIEVAKLLISLRNNAA